MDDDLPINNDRHDLNNMLDDLDVDVVQKEHAKYEKLFVAAEKALFGGCTKLTILSAVIKLFKIKASFGWSDINANEAKLLRWHAEERQKDGKMRHVADSLQWRNIDNSFEEFGGDIRNIQLGLCSSGFNPFGNMSTSYSTSPVLLCNYNLPPWKMIYMGHQRSLLRNHPYRKKKELFDGTIECAELRPPLDEEAMFSRVIDMNIVLGKGIRPELAAKVIPRKRGTYLPSASYTMSKIEKTMFCQCLHGIKVPSGYSANIKKLVSMKDLKLSIHLVSHIVREIKMSGPPSLRNMYQLERYMGYLKGYVRNRSRPEGSIVKGYAAEEVIEFGTNFFRGLYKFDQSSFETAVSTYDFFLAPFIEKENHWVLFVVCPKQRACYILDSHQPKIKKRTERSYWLTSCLNKFVANYKVVECNQQAGLWECGYYVLKWMHEFVTVHQDHFPDTIPWHDNRTFSMSQIEDTIEKWHQLCPI
ncbi:ulp1 protease family, C-terminal catalytic domain-containing protein [Tanacetum coccineum]